MVVTSLAAAIVLFAGFELAQLRTVLLVLAIASAGCAFGLMSGLVGRIFTSKATS